MPFKIKLPKEEADSGNMKNHKQGQKWRRSVAVQHSLLKWRQHDRRAAGELRDYYGRSTAISLHLLPK